MKEFINKIINGNCLEIMTKFPEKSIDMICCDLPYATTECKWDKLIDFVELWKLYEFIIKDNGAIVLFSQTPFDKILGNSNLKLLRYEYIWEKNIPTGFLNANKMPMKIHENILVFYKKLPTYNIQFSKGKPSYKKYVNKTKQLEKSVYGETGLEDVHALYNEGKKYPNSILKFDCENRSEGIHPTQKPVKLFEYLIKTYTNENDIVLDNCMGSGTTAIACINTNRNFVGIELDEKYYKLANSRIEDCYRMKSQSQNLQSLME